MSRWPRKRGCSNGHTVSDKALRPVRPDQPHVPPGLPQGPGRTRAGAGPQAAGTGGVAVTAARPAFYVGVHQPCDAQHFDRCMVSVNRLETRKRDFYPNQWIMDSGAFTRISKGKGHLPVEAYARQIERWAKCGTLAAAVAQDYMCEPFILEKTGLTVEAHQRLTIERYDALLALEPLAYIMPVLQGYQPQEYVDHIRQYADRLKPGMWVGVGSVCKRNSRVQEVEAVATAIARERPDLRLHLFGLKTTALRSLLVNCTIFSADSMAWSFAARREGRNANDWQEAVHFTERIESQPLEPSQLALVAA